MGIIVASINNINRKGGAKPTVVVKFGEQFFQFLAVGGQFRPFQTLRFVVTFQTHPILSLNSLCNPNFDLPNHPQNFLFLGPQNQMYAWENIKN